MHFDPSSQELNRKDKSLHKQKIGIIPFVSSAQLNSACRRAQLTSDVSEVLPSHRQRYRSCRPSRGQLYRTNHYLWRKSYGLEPCELKSNPCPERSGQEDGESGSLGVNERHLASHKEQHQQPDKPVLRLVPEHHLRAIPPPAGGLRSRPNKQFVLTVVPLKTLIEISHNLKIDPTVGQLFFFQALKNIIPPIHDGHPPHIEIVTQASAENIDGLISGI
jgi:hypothetical protein